MFQLSTLLCRPMKIFDESAEYLDITCFENFTSAVIMSVNTGVI